jgi:hypothetical protein
MVGHQQNDEKFRDTGSNSLKLSLGFSSFSRHNLTEISAAQQME